MRFDRPFGIHRSQSESLRSASQPVISVYSVRSNGTDSCSQPQNPGANSPLKSFRKRFSTPGNRPYNKSQRQEDKVCEIPFGLRKEPEDSRGKATRKLNQGEEKKKKCHQLGDVCKTKDLNTRKKYGFAMLPHTRKKNVAKSTHKDIFRQQDNRGQGIPKTISCCTTEDSENAKELSAHRRENVSFDGESLSDGSLCETTVDGQDPPSISSSFSGSDSGYSKEESKGSRRYSSNEFIEGIFFAADEFFGMSDSNTR